MTDQFKMLFSPIKLGSMTAPNRIYVPSHYSGWRGWQTDWFFNDQDIGYWEAKAKGGAGIVCVGVWGVHPTAVWYPDPKNPKYIKNVKRAADAVKKHGSLFVIQIWHPGSQATSLEEGAQVWAPSPVATYYGETQGVVPHAMTKDEIKEIVESYASTAVLLKKAGIDGVEIHGAHSYLLGQFMSPELNKRDDEYGGDLEGRMKFPLEVVHAVREAVGRDFGVALRIDGDQFTRFGYTLDDALVIAPMLAGTGEIDYLNISTGGPQLVSPMYFPMGHSAYLASAIRKVIDIPVGAVGRISDPDQAEKLLQEGHADLIGMNRATICDPELPKKAREGRVEEIRHCMCDSEGCWHRVNIGVTCTYNPVIGKETQPGWSELIPAKTIKKVMVVGGGPGGLETARVAAARGHKVSLWDKGDELGGLVLVAAKAPGRDGFDELPRYYKYQMKMLGVDVHLNTEVTVDTVLKENPDVVVVATGSTPRLPYDIEGIDQDNVVNVRDVLTGKVETGQNVLVVDARPYIEGLTTADFLAERGKTVEVVTAYSYQQGKNVDEPTRAVLMARLLGKGVKITSDTMLIKISGNDVTVAGCFTGVESVIEGIDTVVLSFGSVENNSLYYDLKGKVKELYAVGDCWGVRKIMWATNDGATLARQI